MILFTLYHTGNPQHAVPKIFEYKSIQFLLEAEETMFIKIVGRLLRITQCCEIGGKTPGYTMNYKAKKEKNFINGSFCLL